MKRHFALAILCIGGILQACNTPPQTTRHTIPKFSTNTLQAVSTSNISAEDQKFRELLQTLSKRDPKLEAQQAIISGDHFLIGYYSGRAGLKVPGLSSQQKETQRCTLKTIDGLGDVIYGENHLKYRIAMRNFAKVYNTNMSEVCF